MQELVTEEIKVWALRRGMSHTTLAERAGMKQAYLSRRMTGQIGFDLLDLERLADVLEVDVLDFFPSEPVEPEPATPAPLRPRVVKYAGRGGSRRSRINERYHSQTVRPGLPGRAALPCPRVTADRPADRKRTAAAELARAVDAAILPTTEPRPTRTTHTGHTDQTAPPDRRPGTRRATRLRP